MKRKRLIGAAISFVFLVAILWGGNTWWKSWAGNYQRFMYKPLNAHSTIVRRNQERVMYFRVDSLKTRALSLTRDLNFIIPDHGKLMHMFMVRKGTLDAFAHLHPKRKDSVTFITSLPPLPPGEYFVFADITRLTGFSETIIDTVMVQDEPGVIQLAAHTDPASDRDDTFFLTNAINEKGNRTEDNIIVCGNPGTKVTLPDGSTIIWEKQSNEPFYAGQVYSLRFAAMDELGNAAQLEPYLGMMAHAVVMKDDGSAYIHLHPVGSYSTASQQTMLSRFEQEDGPVNWDRITNRRKQFRDSVDQVVARMDAMPEEERNALLMQGMEHEVNDPDHPDHAIVTFPYVFPSPGNYRIWIQMKRNGQILNSAFDTNVE